jgi:hypothetical protein
MWVCVNKPFDVREGESGGWARDRQLCQFFHPFTVFSANSRSVNTSALFLPLKPLPEIGEELKDELDIFPFAFVLAKLWGYVAAETLSDRRNRKMGRAYAAAEEPVDEWDNASPPSAPWSSSGQLMYFVPLSYFTPHELVRSGVLPVAVKL